MKDTQILTQTNPIVNLKSLEVLIVRAFDKRDEWTLEIVFKGGTRVSTPATVDEINALESELADTEGWRVNPSLYNNGFSARREPCYEAAK